MKSDEQFHPNKTAPPSFALHDVELQLSKEEVLIIDKRKIAPPPSPEHP